MVVHWIGAVNNGQFGCSARAKRAFICTTRTYANPHTRDAPCLWWFSSSGMDVVSVRPVVS